MRQEAAETPDATEDRKNDKLTLRDFNAIASGSYNAPALLITGKMQTARLSL